MGDRLPLKTKIGFGICDLGGNLFFTMMGFYLLFFLTDLVGLAAGLAGTALMIGKIWDAVTDPAVGYMSDRTRSRMGRRRPYMLWGAFALFVSMIVMFTNPGLNSQALLFVWAALAYCLLNTAYTLVNIPYGALLPELTSDFNERTVLTGYRMTFAVVGTFVGAGAVLPLTGLSADPTLGWALMGGITGGLMATTTLVTVIMIREPQTQTPPPVGTGAVRAMAQALGTRVFLLALIPWVLHVTGVTVIQGALLYYFTYIYEAQDQFQVALLFLLGVCLLLIPVWVAISRRIGKKLSYNLGMSLFAVTVMVFFVFGVQGGVPMAYVIMAVAGIGFATHYVMPHSILPDVVEYDYAETGARREGIYYGLWTFGSKVGQAFAIALSGWVLGAVGYRPLESQDALARLGIRLLCGPIPALFFVAGVVVLAFYPIDRQRYEGILEKIRARDASAG